MNESLVCLCSYGIWHSSNSHCCYRKLLFFKRRTVHINYSYSWNGCIQLLKSFCHSELINTNEDFSISLNNNYLVVCLGIFFLWIFSAIKHWLKIYKLFWSQCLIPAAECCNGGWHREALSRVFLSLALWSLFLVCAIIPLWERQGMPCLHRSVQSRGWRAPLKRARCGFDSSQGEENTECRSSAFWMSTSASHLSWAVKGSLHHSALWKEKSEVKICTQRTDLRLWASLSHHNRLN